MPDIASDDEGDMKETPKCIEMLLCTSHIPIKFDETVCTGCNNCVEACMNDVLVPHPEKKNPPIVFHPDECWYCGCCVMECPHQDKDAIEGLFSRDPQHLAIKPGHLFLRGRVDFNLGLVFGRFRHALPREKGV